MAVFPSRDYELLESKAKERERKYNWEAATEFYEEALEASIKQRDFSSAAKINEQIGFCYNRAAFQSSSPQEFRSLSRHAIDSYSRAAELLEKAADPDRLARASHCRAMRAYIGSRLESDPVSRKKMLDECCSLEREALTSYRRTSDRLSSAKACNDLNTFLFDWIMLEWNRQLRQKTLKEALESGEKAIDTLSKLKHDPELARAYCLTATHYDTAAKGLELERQSEYGQKALMYSEKAMKLSGRIGDHHLLGISNIWLGTTITNFTDRPDFAERHFKDALKCGKRTGDKYIIGRAHYLLAFHIAWKIVAEEEPEEIRKQSKKCEKHCENAINNFRIILNDEETATGYYWLAENNSFLARSTKTSPKRRRSLLEESIKAGKKGLELARRSGSIRATWMILHPLSKSLFYLSTMEKNTDLKKKLLEKSLRYREENIKTIEQAWPYFFWNHGVYHNYLAQIQAELARTDQKKTRKEKLLEEAVNSARRCIDLCLQTRTLSKGQYTILGRYYSDLAGILRQLHQTTGSNRLLIDLQEAFKGAVQSYERADLPSRAAESQWQLARIYDEMNNCTESARSFELSHQNYVTASERIPSLSEFYLDYASYMKGWSEIEKAKHYHESQKHDLAKQHYEKAATLHESSKNWNYLSANYLAWGQLEHGESLSRQERIEEARDAFKHAADLFKKAKESIQAKLKKAEIPEERGMITDLLKASDTRHTYCLGRIALEEAKALDREGEYVESSQRYGSAAEEFQKAIASMKDETDRRELKPIAYLCQAWQMMSRAEAEASPQLYLQASQLFDVAKQHSSNKRAKLLALGHSCFCKALEAGRRFEATRDEGLHTAATQHLEGAANYYVRAGFKGASEYANATQRLFDAHMYTHRAKTEIDPMRKTQYYQISERLFQASADSFARAKNPEKSKSVQRILESVKEERELASSLTEILSAPTILSTTTSFSTPSATHERAVGLERFEHMNVQADLHIDSGELKVGEDLNLTIRIANVGKEAVLLSKIEEIFPEDFDLVDSPSYCDFAHEHLNMKGKRLDPLRIDEVELTLRPLEEGSYEVSPKLVYMDEAGHQKVTKPEPAIVNIQKSSLPGRIAVGYNDLDNMLFGGVPEGCSVILTSPSCDERDLLVRSFLESGVREEQLTFLVTVGAAGARTLAEEFPSSFFVFVCNPQADKIFKSLPNVFKLKGIENLTQINIALASAFRGIDESSEEPRRACLEIISDILLQHHAISTRRWLAALIPDLRSRGFTTLAVMNPEMHPKQEAQAILDLFDGEISIYEKESGKGHNRYLRVRRMQNHKYHDGELRLRKERLKLGVRGKDA